LSPVGAHFLKIDARGARRDWKSWFVNHCSENLGDEVLAEIGKSGIKVRFVNSGVAIKVM
jgi:hypothetical protein